MCGCNRKKTITAGVAPASVEYNVVLDTGEVLGPYLTPLEAKREIRKNGGGTIEKVASSAA